MTSYLKNYYFRLWRQLKQQKLLQKGQHCHLLWKKKKKGQGDPAATTENVEEDGVEKTEVCFFN